MPPIPRNRKQVGLYKVISGGQTGADQAGLRAARSCGLDTGGWLPRGCVTLDGPRPDLLVEYGMAEHPGGYKDRTLSNVRDGDATVRFASNWQSPGELCTLRSLRDVGRPHFDVDVLSPVGADDLAEWVSSNRVGVLNVAGNSEQTSPGIGEFVFSYLVEVLNLMKNPAKWARTASTTPDNRPERLAVNLFDVTRIDPEVVGILLGGKLDRHCPPVNVDPKRGDEQCVPFTCPLVDAGAVLDTVRNHDRRLGLHPTRAYLQKFKGGAWYKLASVTVLTVVEGGEVVLNPLLFPPGPSLVSLPPPPVTVAPGGRKSARRPG